ncbi:MAG TPA: hypothetical protein VGE74_13560 [Gemmata sp.]
MRPLRALGGADTRSCNPSSYLLSKKTASMLQRRQYPAIAHAAASVLVANSTSSRYTPATSRTSTTVIGAAFEPVHHNTFRATWTLNLRVVSPNPRPISWVGYAATSSII